jgi:3',5'-cyclic AMP phosphodiesterase CpdA
MRRRVAEHRSARADFFVQPGDLAQTHLVDLLRRVRRRSQFTIVARKVQRVLSLEPNACDATVTLPFFALLARESATRVRRPP